LRTIIGRIAVLVILAAVVARADDWPEIRGKGRLGVWHESGILEKFPESGLKVLWRTPIKGDLELLSDDVNAFPCYGAALSYLSPGKPGIPAHVALPHVMYNVVVLPGQTAQGQTVNVFTHVTDDTATFLALAGATPPSQAASPATLGRATTADGGALYTPKFGPAGQTLVVYKGNPVYPVTGQSLLPLLQGTSAARVHTAAFGDESYGRAYVYSADGAWKLRWTEPPFGPADGHWELFAIQTDRGETTDVSAANPAVVTALTQSWLTYMNTVGGEEPLRPFGYY